MAASTIPPDPDAPPTGPSPAGSVLRGGYHVVDVLQGGMGVVYVCHQPSTRQLYALKTVRFDGTEAEVEARLSRFALEVQNWVRVSQARCDKIVDARSFDADERLLILEFIDGLPISKIAPKGVRVHPEHVLDWAEHIAEAMELLHLRFRLLHRDLKPQNVLVAREGLIAKVTDLGIGKLLADGGEEEGTIAGTRGYIAPECQVGVVSFRSDIYSYGATLYRMLVGALPSPAGDALLVGSPWRAFLERCLAVDPARRYASFAEIREELARIRRVPPTVDGGLYRFCAAHRFHSPVAPHLPTCLFCHQKEELDRRVRESLTATTDDVDGGDSQTAFLSDTDESTGASTGGRAALRDVPVPSEARPRDTGEPSPIRGRRRRGWSVIVLGAAVLVAVGALLLPPSGGDDPAPVHPGGGPLPSGPVCATDGCGAAVASDAACASFLATHPDARPWTSRHCDEHSPYRCSECSRRYTEDEFARYRSEFPERMCFTCGDHNTVSRP